MRKISLFVGLVAVLLLGALPTDAQPVRRIDSNVIRDLQRPDLRRIVPITGLGAPLYFADCQISPGSVYRYNRITRSKTTLYTRPSGLVSAFAFAPWDPDRLYLVNANGRDIFQVPLGGATPTETVVHTHSTYVRDIAFDDTHRLYFSEATGGGGDGKIWRIDSGGTVSLFADVLLSEVGFWAGDFSFAPDGTLLVSSGNLIGASLYELDVATGAATKLYTATGESLTGFAHDFNGALYSTNHAQRIYNLDLAGAGTATVVLDDPAQQWICDVNFRPSAPTTPTVTGNWVMPWGVRGFGVHQIKPSGLVDYTDGASGIAMVDAPFGGGLYLRLDSSNTIPTPQVHYYRYLYRRQGTSGWSEITAPVSVSYIRNHPAVPPGFSFHTMSLGPVAVNSMNLYRFRPHVPPGPGSVEWPKIPRPGDLWRGYLDTVGLNLPPGPYDLRLEVFSSAGVQTAPGPAYQMLVPNGTPTPATATVVGGGFEFTVHIDNRSAHASIDAPSIGSSLTDACGFLRYDPAAPGETHIGWHASHPADFAFYIFNIIKAASGIGSLPLPGVPGDPTPSVAMPFREEVGSAAHHADGAGNFFENSPTDRLLDGCLEAAFAGHLHVYAKATTGNGYRITQYDDSMIRAFAIAPE